MNTERKEKPMKTQKQLTRAVIILALVCTILAFWLVRIYGAERAYTDGPNYSITIYEDGKARVDVINVNLINQEPDGDLVIEGDSEVII